MESSTSSAPSPSSPAMSAAAPASRASPLRWLAGFGPSGLLGLAVLLFWLLAAAFGPWLLSYSTVATGTSNVFSPISAAHWLRHGQIRWWRTAARTGSISFLSYVTWLTPLIA